ncbi:hypothetical protein BKA25_002760 [Actinoalloteichus hymeniacidonis]|uniref:Uncharacterized protein n=1 Tax=Actinoalloteichus hymeniacidonis TaxID=340345 RepID=A0AAC9MYZ3_9PSEU|nr:hypothetical protein TL08_13490 [Actinoalloteichus hymeniacidonis]MBB5908444.1 hypothetical protein [Actinoalloteichus hymeniacidonis]
MVWRRGLRVPEIAIACDLRNRSHTQRTRFVTRVTPMRILLGNCGA